MVKSKVAVIRCETYEHETLKAALHRGIELLGGVGSFINSGEKILLKPNVLFGDKPASCTTTHPAILKATGQLLQEAGAVITYGDSSALTNPQTQVKSAGYVPVSQELGMPLADFINSSPVDLPDLDTIRQVPIARGVLEADGLVNLCKMKPHGLTRVTGAVKNTFGCIPGLAKGELHVKAQSVYHFCRLLVVLNRTLKPRLHIMDGIWAMEGNGPRGGDRTRMNTLLFSTDPVALDAVMCRLMALNPEFVPTITEGKRLGLGVYATEDVELVGDPLESLINPAFKVLREPVKDIKIHSAFHTMINLYAHRPVINGKLCIRCGLCIKSCPVTPKAVDWRNKNKKRPPRHRYRNCIRCFCCQEVCPEKAIRVTRPLLGKLLSRLGVH